jgi:SRSO17 transposase
MRQHEHHGRRGVVRLKKYFEEIGNVLGSDERRASFALYAQGLMSSAERKSVEPLAVQGCIDPAKADAAHQRLLHFVGVSPWSDRAVRREAAHYALEAITEHEPVEAWIVDDTGFLKQGKHSVGVQRQYTGSAGKITNCQVGVSLAVATLTEHLPIDFELYLPAAWANDPARRAEARIPDEVQFKTKPELALEMIKRAIGEDIPKGVVLGDSGYGSSSDFRRELRALQLRYVVGVQPTTIVQPVDVNSKPEGKPASVRDLATTLDTRGAFRRCTWRVGTRNDLSARFAMLRVQPSDDEEVWLLIEWRDDEAEPANYFFASFPRKMPKKKLIRIAMQRWRIERTYEDLKGELGLDHYEGRRFPGWHHHVTVALTCYAFVVAERSRRFPPSPTRSLENLSHAVAA